MEFTDNEIRRAVRNRYRDTVTGKSSCCGNGSGGTSGGQSGTYSFDQLQTIPAGSDLGLGCGNPTVAAAPRERETVLDLGSGAGVDCFLASAKVGPEGRVIGVDMTPEMVEQARQNAESGGYTNVEFRLGEIEALPVADGTVDLIISNCVINLSPRKDAVFAEAFRVLKPGGRLVISDIVAERTPTDEERANMDLYSACVSGAETAAVVERLLHEAGFTDTSVDMARTPFDWGDPDAPVTPVFSATIKGGKPVG